MIIENLLNIEKEDIELLSERDNIIIRGLRGTGKTTLAFKILKTIIKRFISVTNLILIPKENVDIININKLNLEANIIVVWDDITNAFKSGIVGNVIKKNIKYLYKITQQEKLIFKFVGNYRNEEIKPLIVNDFFSDQFFATATIIETNTLDDNELIKEALNLYSKAFELNLNLEENLILNMFIYKIKKNPTIGYLVSLFNLLKYLYSNKSIKEISLDTITNLPTNLDLIWKNNFNLIDRQSKKILYAIRLLYEFNLIKRIDIVKFLYTNYYYGEETIFRSCLNKLTLIGWISLLGETIVIWDVKIESIPLEIKQDIDKKLYSHLIKIIKSDIINIDKDYSINWINNIAQKIFLKDSSKQSMIKRSLSLYQYANDLKENAWSNFGTALNYETLYSVLEKVDPLKNIDLIEKAIEFYKKADVLNPNDFPTLNNLGSCFHKIFPVKQHSQKRKVLSFAIDYYKLAKKISPNNSVVYINEAQSLYDITVIDLQEGILSDSNELNKKNKNILELTKKAYDLLPFIAIINENEKIRYECYILELEGRIYTSIGSIFNDSTYFEEAEKKYLKAFNLNNNFFYAFLGLARVNYYKSLFSNFEDKDSLDKALYYLKKFAEYIGNESFDSSVLKLQCKYAKLKGKPILEATKESIIIDKELEKVYKKRPKYERESILLNFWIELRADITKCSPTFKIKKIFINKFVDTSLLNISKYPFKEDINNFENTLLELYQLIPLKAIKKKIIKKVKKFSRKYSKIYSNNNITQLISKIEKIYLKKMINSTLTC